MERVYLSFVESVECSFDDMNNTGGVFFLCCGLRGSSKFNDFAMILLPATR
jgi:hypothetical protein